MRFLSAVISFSIELNAVRANGQFRSRPDLSPPTLNITVSAHPFVESGLIFVGPYLGFEPGSWGPQQAGAYIFRDNGDLVWSSQGRLGGWITDFHPTVWNGNAVLQAFEGSLDARHGRMYGKHSLLNEGYDIIKTVVAGSHRLVSCHEFRLTEDNTVLLETPLSIPTDLSKWGGKKDQTWIVSNGFQELDINTGDVLFEWFSFDHVDPQYTAFPLEHEGNFNSRNSTDAWNYFHINSVDKNSDGDYLISARNYRAIFKINGKTGEIIWQLGGGHGSDFPVPKSLEFAYQHDARFISKSDNGATEIISLFDNAAHSTPGREISPFSRARFIQLNHISNVATEVATFSAPDSLSTKSQGNVQRLPNGNVFVNWGQAGAVTEFAWNGDILFHAYLDSEPDGKNVQSYRGFRANWTGTPSEEPAIVAIASLGANSKTTVYVTWNGDTETVAWRFFAELSNVQESRSFLLGQVERISFETSIELNKNASEEVAEHSIFAEAISAHGKVLVSTRKVSVKQHVVHVAEDRAFHKEQTVLSHLEK